VANTRTAAADPIFAAIKRVRRAGAKLERVDEFADPVGFATVSGEYLAACDTLANTKPVTLAGIQALVSHRLAEARLVAVSKALARLSP
jgi:hypothetical protein